MGKRLLSPSVTWEERTLLPQLPIDTVNTPSTGGLHRSTPRLTFAAHFKKMQKVSLNGCWLRSQLAGSQFHKWLLPTRRKSKVQFAKHVHGLVNRAWMQAVAQRHVMKPPENPSRTLVATPGKQRSKSLI